MEHVKVVRGYWHDCTQWQDAPQIRLIEYVWALLCIFNRFPSQYAMCFTRVPQEEKKRKRRRRSVESWDFQGTATCELQSQVEQYISLKVIIICNYFHIVIWHQYILWISTSQFRCIQTSWNDFQGDRLCGLRSLVQDRPWSALRWR